MTRGTVRIGISGWRYAPWRGVFYPKGLPQRCELAYAARAFPSIEINGSFYSLQRPESWASWYRDTPADFMFSVKGPRFLTHMKRLKEVTRPLANFLASGVFELREKLGPILWQLPPNFRYDAQRIEAFLQLLPRDTAAAARVARRRDSRMRGRSRLSIDARRPLRHALEVRHESFCNEEFIALLRRLRVALVVTDTPQKWPRLHDVTADFVYLRLHGDKHLYRSEYGAAALGRWARHIHAWARGGEVRDGRFASVQPAPRRARRDVYCYFDNDVKVKAPGDARRLARRLEGPARC